VFSKLLKNNNYLSIVQRMFLVVRRLHPVELPLERFNISPVSKDWHSHHGTMV
jgi:hypothetical protein